MMRTKYLPLAAVLATIACTAQAQSTAPAKWADTLSMEIDKAAMAGDLAKVQAARALADRVATAFPDDGLILHYQAFAMFREATLSGARGADAGALLDRALGILEKSAKTRPLAESYAIMASIDGQLIGRDPSRAMELGIASQAASQAALTRGPTNPRVWLVRGMNALYTPEEYGGGVKTATEQLERAIALFAKDAPKPGEPSWGRAEAHAWLGQAYEKAGDKAKAAESYKTALSIAPNYAFAKSLSATLK
jgi:tetratricopeptide (TPR) repeat protein